MPKVYQKKIANKSYLYLTEQFKINGEVKKIQVYLGKSTPNNLQPYYDLLLAKEKALLKKYVDKLFIIDDIFNREQIIKIENLKSDFKYKMLTLSDFKQERLWIRYAVQFIFESNAIEGSRLSSAEVHLIINKKRISAKIERREIREVQNSIKAFNLIKSGKFKLNQQQIINLHKLLTNGLGIQTGYKKLDNIVNNKQTVPAGQVRIAMGNLLRGYNMQKKTKLHPLLLAANFHQRFESIHPFADGNGRIGRLLFNWILWQYQYPPILFLYQNRQSYFNCLNQADEGRKKNWHWFCLRVYKKSGQWLLKQVS